ncbi:MAG: hypothetical protein M1282_18080 [Chloroflexi bacterium]|nr:hypothetical protein [Chloroflexota bacterium]
MDNYDFNDQPVKRSGSQLSIWDLLTALVLLATVCIGGYFLLIFINPNSPFNPFPPLPTPLTFPTATITPIQPPATWTPTFVDITDTPTLVSTITLQPSPTGFSLIPPSKTPQPTKTPKPTATPTAPFSANVSYIQSTIIHPDSDCKWLGVGGTVVDANNAPMIYMSVRLVGTLNGTPINKLNVSGTSPDYGQSGWEFVLGDTPVASTKTLYVQLLDQAGLPLSNNIYINTYTDCSKNLVLVRFKKNR